MTILHDFEDQLAWGEAQGYEPFWTQVYRKAFPNMVNHMLGSGDTQSQRMGIDRIILLSNGRMLRIDEKKRRQDYPDILLEYVSVDTTNAPGWIEKDLAIDYLAYAFMPSKRCYLFDWLMLRRAWLRYGDEWKQAHRIVTAQNKSYKTYSVAVPIEVVRNAVRQATVIDVSKELADWIVPGEVAEHCEVDRL